MEAVIHRNSHFGTQNNVSLQRYVGLQTCRIKEVDTPRYFLITNIIH